MHRILTLTTLFLTVMAACGDADPVPETSTVAPPTFLPLIGEGLFPEGIIAADNGDLFVTGFGDGAILRVQDGTDVTHFKDPGEDGLSSAVGLVIDEARNRLWVANFDFATFSSNMKVFDLETADLMATVTPTVAGPHFFNEVTIDTDGRIYVSDTLMPRVWTAGPDLAGIEVFVEDDLLLNPNRPFGLNGLTRTPDGTYLIASVMDRIQQGDGRLVRIEVATRQVQDIALSGVTNQFGGGDGILFEQGGALLMVNVTPPAAIVTAHFDDRFTSAELVGRDRFDADYDRPTSTAIRNGRLWVVGSQLDHIIDDENGALDTPPELPFQLTHVSLDELLAE